MQAGARFTCSAPSIFSVTAGELAWVEVFVRGHPVSLTVSASVGIA